MARWITGLILVCAVLLLGFTTLTHSASLDDPFSPYAELLASDQTIQVVQKLGFSCVDTMQTVGKYCSLTPDGEIFEKITLTTQWDSIASISFEVHENRLQVGDLMALWGKPTQFGTNNRSDLLVWPKRNDTRASAIVVRVGRLNYFTSVLKITFVY